MISTQTNNTIKRLILTTIFFLAMAGVVSATQQMIFQGNVVYPNGTNAQAVNVSLAVPGFMTQQNAGFNGSWSALTNANGNFTVNVTFTSDALYNGLMLRFRIIANTSGSYGLNNTYIGPFLPDFPVTLYSSMLNNNTFFMKPAGVVFINVTNTTSSVQNFSYIIRDGNTGNEVESVMERNPTKHNYYVTLPLPYTSTNNNTKNYTITVFVPQTPPLSYLLSNFTSYNLSGTRGGLDVPHRVSILFNTSTAPQYFAGYIRNATQANFTNNSKFEIWFTMIESGSFVCANDDCLVNASALQPVGDTNLLINATSGFFNLSLPGTISGGGFNGFNVMLFALVNSSNGNWYLGMQNVTSIYQNPAQFYQNITLLPIANGSSYIAGTNIKAPQTIIRLVNESGTPLAAIAGAGMPGGLELTLDYGLGFYPRIFMQTNNSGVATFPLTSLYGVRNARVFMNNYPPRETKFTAAQMDGDINITLYPMKTMTPEGDLLDSNMVMLYSNTSCDVMQPVANCYIGGDTTGTDTGSFNPMSALLKGAVSMRMIFTNGLILHYKNVDMIASGPPDFVTSGNATNSVSGRGAVSDIWSLGSRGPKIYDSVLIGINQTAHPIDVNANASLRIFIKNLYDADNNLLWNVTANGTTWVNIIGNVSDYTDYNETWFTTGRLCNVSEGTLLDNSCFYNGSSLYMWLALPHFSNSELNLNGVGTGGLNMTVPSSTTCIQGNCVIYFNITNYNFTISQGLVNISINISSPLTNDTNVNITWKLNTSASFTWNGTNHSFSSRYNLTYYNESNPANTTHYYMLNISRPTNVTTQLKINYTIIDFNGVLYDLTYNLSLQCVESWSYTAWGGCNGGVQTRTATDARACGTTTTREAVTQSCSSGASSSSAGGGSNPIVTHTWASMTVGETYTYSVGKSDMSISKISVTPNANLMNVKLVVRQWNDKPSDLGRDPVGTVYKYTEVVRENLQNSQIAKASIIFNVDKTWIDAKGDKNNIVLLRDNNGVWEKLETKYLGVVGNNYQYQADTNGFSYFAITYQTVEQKAVQQQIEKKVAAGATVEEAIKEAEAASNVDTTQPENVFEEKQAKKTSWKPIVIALVVLLVIGVVFYFVYKKKKDDSLSAYRYRPNGRR